MRRTSYLLALAALGLFLGAGCDRYIDSRDPVSGLPSRPPRVVNLAAALESQAVRLTWEVTDTASTIRYRVYVSDSTSAAYGLEDSTTSFSYTVTNLLLNQKYFFTVAAVVSSGIEGERSNQVSARVGVLGVTIDNDNRYTRDRDVTLQFVAPSSATHLLVADNEAMTGAAPLPFAASRPYALTGDDGLKTVFVRYLFGDGSSSGDPVFDQITLDTRAAIDSVYYAPAAAAFDAGDQVSLYLRSNEIDGVAQVSIAGITPAIVLRDDGIGVDVLNDDGVYSGLYIVPASISVTSAELTGSFADAAGNQAPSVVATRRITIASPPTAVEFTTLEPLSTFQVRLNWVPTTESGFASYRVYRGLNASVSDTSRLVATLSTRSIGTLTDTALNANTNYFYRLYVTNSAGLSTASAVRSARTLVNAAPTGVVLAATLDDTNSVRLTWSRNSEDDFQSYQIYRDTIALVDLTSPLVSLINDRTTDFLSDYLPQRRSYYYKVYVFDRHGLSTGSNEVVVTKP